MQQDFVERFFPDGVDGFSQDHILAEVKKYYSELAAQKQEDRWRKKLSTLENEDPIVATLLTTEWLVKGPQALKVLEGGHSDFIETEAQLISLFSPDTPKTPMQVAQDIAGRFTFWIRGGMLLTSLRRAMQHRISVQDTPDKVRVHFLVMREMATVVGEAAGDVTDQASFSSLQGMLSSLATFSTNTELISSLVQASEAGATDEELIAAISEAFENAIS